MHVQLSRSPELTRSPVLSQFASLIRHVVRLVSLVLVSTMPGVRPTQAADWSMWRCDATRSAASAEELPSELHLQWTRTLSPRKPAWDDELNRDLMTYDRVLEPIVHGGRLFLGFSDRDKLVAYDAASGRELWSFFASGPVRLPPAARHESVYFASDDGHLYCLNVSDGTVRWKFRGGPNQQQILGNQRLISAWPMRGGPVIRDGRVYVAAGIWPFMGTFLYALDADSGEVVWVNDETGSKYLIQPHSAPSFAGIAPQGALVATENKLLVPGGRSVPAAFDRATGKMLYFELNAGGKGTGGSFLAANDESWFVHTRQKETREFALETGVKTAFLPNEPVLAQNRIFAAATDGDKQVVRAHDVQSKKVLWQLPVDAQGDLILAGRTMYAASKPAMDGNTPAVSALTGIRLAPNDGLPTVIWTASVAGTVERLVAANGQLFAVTLEGGLFAFGADRPNTVAEWKDSKTPLKVAPHIEETASALLKAGTAEGYAFWLGGADEELARNMAASSPFSELTIVDHSPMRVANLRQQLDAASRYGQVTVHDTHLSEFSPPPYVANMIFSSPATTSKLIGDTHLLARLYESLRPYGGTLCLQASPSLIPEIEKTLGDLKLSQSQLDVHSWGLAIRRVGALPGSGTWTHQYGNIANTIKSNDSIVKLPLGVLWFGGVSHADVLPRHGHGPPEQVVGGRLFIQGMNSLTARDVYTGRVLWSRTFENLGTYDVYFDDTYKNRPLDPAYNQVHIPGANARGTNYVVTPDRIYLIEGAIVHVLDPATGNTLLDISLPKRDPNQSNDWGYIGVYEDVLIGGIGFAQYRDRLEFSLETDAQLSSSKRGFGAKSLDRAASMALVGFDRYTGKVKWRVDARHSFWHNGIVAGKGRVFALDKNPKPVEDFLKRRGKTSAETYRLLAFDAQSGETTWELNGQVFGTWLGYSEELDLLLQAGAAASDRLTSEVAQGMAVYRGSSGELVWKKEALKYSGPCVLHHDLIITNANSYAQSAGAFRLSDGSPKMVQHPLTGELQPWRITRAYGCNSIVASENLLTFRSGAAGFYDLLTEAGTGNFGGFRSGCTSNLIAADGVLNAPDYTRTCSCSYQNQTSLALVHMPNIETWTVHNSVALDPADGRVRQLGINLGAPGDRRDQHGLVWLEYPTVAGESPNFGLEIHGPTRFFQQHTSSMPYSWLPWVASSGVEGWTGLKLSLKALPMYLLRSGIPVASADDDGEETADGTVKLDGSTLTVGQVASETPSINKHLTAFRFNKIRLVRGSEIASAHLQLVCGAMSDVGCDIEIQAEASGNAEPLSNKTRDISRRSVTTSKIRWSPAGWTKEGDAGAAQQTPDIAPLIREVIARDDWKPGNSIVIVVRGTGQRIVGANRGRIATAARLIVDADEFDPNSKTAQQELPYSVKLHFGVPRGKSSIDREFHVSVNGQARAQIVLAGRAGTSKTHTFERVMLGDCLEMDVQATAGEPLLSGLELHRLDE